MVGFDILGSGGHFGTFVRTLEMTLLVAVTAVHKLRVQVKTLFNGVSRLLTMVTKSSIISAIDPGMDFE